jgi:hypothetical protein
MTEPEPERVLAITEDNTLMHVAAPAALLVHVDAENDPASGDPPIEYEFYDPDGTRLVRVDSEEGAYFETSPTAAEPTAAARQLLVDRTDLILARAQVIRDEQVMNSPQPPTDNLRVPRVTGELPEVLRALEAIFASTETAPHGADWVHNVIHRIFG